MTLKFKKVKDSDIGFLVKLRELTMIEQMEKAGLCLSNQEHLSRIRSYFDSTYIIYQSNLKVGMIKYFETQNTLEIVQLQILPPHQSQGIGKTVLNNICSKYEFLDKAIKLKVLKDSPAIKLYERIGFQIFDADEYEFYMQHNA
jgi:ribosomal protein S18 acetylase RimI-like enzyme